MKLLKAGAYKPADGVDARAVDALEAGVLTLRKAWRNCTLRSTSSTQQRLNPESIRSHSLCWGKHLNQVCTQKKAKLEVCLDLCFKNYCGRFQSLTPQHFSHLAGLFHIHVVCSMCLFFGSCSKETYKVCVPCLQLGLRLFDSGLALQRWYKVV